MKHVCEIRSLLSNVLYFPVLNMKFRNFSSKSCKFNVNDANVTKNWIIVSHISEMEANQFREFGKAMIDYTAEYLENIRDR